MAKAKKVPFALRSHSEAPLLTGYTEGQRIIEQLITEITGHLTTQEDIRQHLRQVGLVSLWFFLKYILGYNGPYNELNDDIHLQMANWRQSDACMGPGARGAGFVPRAFMKSTIWSHGADTWEIVRFPNIRIRLESGVMSKAEEFMGNIKNSFETNELLHWLYPETKIPDGYERTGKWSSLKIVIPSRTRHFTEATVTIGSMSGASEGGHFNLYNCDDPVGLDDLDAMRNSSIDMFRKKNRFITNKSSLLVKPKQDRVLLIGTRYAVDDIYDIAINDAKEFIGYRVPEFKEKDSGEWSVYNRLAEEDGTYINEDVVNEQVLQKAMEEDMWYAMTQLMNYPQKTGLAEFYQLRPKFARLKWSEQYNDYLIMYDDDPNFTSEVEREFNAVKLGDCDVVMSVDPAGTDTGVSAKTSRSSIGVWTRDSEDRVTRIWGKVGYFSPGTLFDGMFEGNNKFKGYIRATYIESNAMQKIILPILKDEQWRKKEWINPQPLPAKGDKKARIRNVVGYSLAAGKLYLLREYSNEFLEEHAVFPMNEYKMDVLDESEKGITATRTPKSAEQITEQMIRETSEELELIENAFGY
jgi:hypothetical protein